MKRFPVLKKINLLSMTSLRRSARIAAMNATKRSSKLSSNISFTEMDTVASNTISSIRRLIQVIKDRGDKDVYAADAIVNLMCAKWSIEDAIEYKMKRKILQGSQAAINSVPSIIHLMTLVGEELERDILVFSEFERLPRSLVIAASSVGLTIKQNFYSD